jgi:hypothetical protein
MKQMIWGENSSFCPTFSLVNIKPTAPEKFMNKNRNGQSGFLPGGAQIYSGGVRPFLPKLT